jgi:hypothetical protein
MQQTVVFVLHDDSEYLVGIFSELALAMQAASDREEICGRFPISTSDWAYYGVNPRQWTERGYTIKEYVLDRA